jgi:hypothetical protein
MTGPTAPVALNPGPGMSRLLTWACLEAAAEQHTHIATDRDRYAPAI